MRQPDICGHLSGLGSHINDVYPFVILLYKCHYPYVFEVEFIFVYIE